MPKAQRVLVVGGGIAGMALACELPRHGIDVDLIEVEPESVFRGIGIALLPPALRSMHMLGLADECVERGFPHYVFKSLTPDGRLLATTPLQGLLGPSYPPSIGIPRMEFGDILRTRALHNGSNLRFGLTVGELRNGEYGVEALLTDGSSQTYDLVVGADGLRSTVRSMIFPAAPPPTYIGQHIWRVLVGNRPPEIDSQMLFVGERSRVGLNPILPDDMYIYLLNQAEESREKLTDKDAHAQLMELFGDYGGIAREIASGLSLDCPAHHASLYTIFMEGPWHQGRVVLIGDAAHATPPHLAGGAAIAIEDAIVLARLLGTGDSVTEVFESFMNQRYERCRMVINNSRQLSRWDLDPNVDGRKAAALTTQTWEKLAVPI